VPAKEIELAPYADRICAGENPPAGDEFPPESGV
jgi:hypothetical protein